MEIHSLKCATETLASLCEPRAIECCICLDAKMENGYVQQRCANCVTVAHIECLPTPKECPVCQQSFTKKAASPSEGTLNDLFDSASEADSFNDEGS